MDGPSLPQRPGYTPTAPSQLRESHRPPSSPSSSLNDNEHPQEDPGFLLEGTAQEAYNNHGSDDGEADTTEQREPLRHRRPRLSHRNWDAGSGCGSENCKHGSFSPYTGTPRGYSAPGTPMYESSFRLAYNAKINGNTGDDALGLLGNTIVDGSLGNKTVTSDTTGRLPRTNGAGNSRFMYLEYYVPFVKWIRQYRWSFVVGDLIAALTMASFYIPMSLSLAANLAHVPAINGLYTFAINPLIYALLGTCPQMVVGPEAAGSLLTGNVVRDSITKGRAGDDDVFFHGQIAGTVTGLAGGILLLAGGARLGFLDNVLSKPFLRGFISAVGVVIFVDQLIPEMGLSRLAAATAGVSHGSCVNKAIFLVKHVKSAHGLTSAVSFGAFAIIMVCREVKRRLQPRFPKVAFLPDRFCIVALATILCWQLRWDQQGLTVLGDARSATGKPFPIQFPFQFSLLKNIDTALSTSFVVALLGFFESSVAAKSLGAGPSDGIQNMNLSANRELVALGAANLVGSVFMALPGFGGYGRSKVNASTGGKTPMSSVFLSIITIICIYFLLPYFYYIPKGVLSAMISVVAYSLVEEAPHDLRFFWHIGGWSELFLIFIVFAATIFYSMSLGIACGIGFSILRVIKHATRPRIQILGRVRGTTDQFENAETHPDRYEFFKGCLIVKIPEPLTFANTGDLRNRLQKLIDYGSVLAHDALPRVREQSNNKNIIFDVHGVTSLDAAGAQVLSEILEAYKAQGTRIFFCRVPSPRTKVYNLLEKSGIIDICGGPRHFVQSVQEALRMTELESLTEEFRDYPDAAV